MHLVIFDIDGTLVDSVGIDDQCFIQSLQDLFDIYISGADWTQFKHVTDSGLTYDIFRAHIGRPPSEDEAELLKGYFYDLIAKRVGEIKEIDGAKVLLASLMENAEVTVAFATGGWKETAILKLSAIGFELNGQAFASATEHFDRKEIMQLAIEKSLEISNSKDFDSIMYVGDGVWDCKAAKALGIGFIAVDSKGNNRLKNEGADQIVTDLTDKERITKWIKSAGKEYIGA